jgi:transposase
MLVGSMNGPAFDAYIKESVARELRPGDIVVLDNLSAHKLASIAATIEQTGAQLVYLPAYSPDLSPIELAWSKAKSMLRKAAARTPRRLLRAVTRAPQAITPQDAIGWFRHCAYRAAFN